MTRVSDSELRALVQSDPAKSVVTFLDDAHLIVEEILVNQGLTEARLKLIEKYLAAHFYLVAEENGGLIRAKVGESEESYVGANSRAGTMGGLRGTRWGQQALAMDTTGLLEVMATEKKKAQLRVV